MPLKNPKKGKGQSPRLFPPSLAGSCLRYAVMDVLGFGRMIGPESQAAMRAGSEMHKVFQAELLRAYAMCAVEVTIRDNTWGVSGRMDALMQTTFGSWVVEYKTVSAERFERIRQAGPFTSHWAQLQLYMAVGAMTRGTLVVDQRPTGGRLIFHAEPDPGWNRWLRARIDEVKTYQETRKLPSREVSRECLSCDRWQRCFASEEAREQAVAAHPLWEPDPGRPPDPAFFVSEHIARAFPFLGDSQEGVKRSSPQG